MTVAPAYCPSCGQPQAAGRNFCSNCGQRLTEPARATGHANLAASMLDLQRFWWKVQAGRIVGLLAGVAVWWFIVGPLLGSSQPLLVLVSLPVLAFVGLWTGGQLVLEAIAGGGRR